MKLKTIISSIGVFGHENKEKHPIYVSKICCEEKHIALILIGEESKNQYVPIRNLNTFLYNHTSHCGRKYFFHCCLQAFSPEKSLKRHINDRFKINGRQRIIMPKKAEYHKFKNYEKKNKVSIYD